MEFEEFLNLFKVIDNEEEEYLISADLLRKLLFCYIEHHIATYIRWTERRPK